MSAPNKVHPLAWIVIGTALLALAFIAYAFSQFYESDADRIISTQTAEDGTPLSELFETDKRWGPDRGYCIVTVRSKPHPKTGIYYPWRHCLDCPDGCVENAGRRIVETRIRAGIAVHTTVPIDPDPPFWVNADTVYTAQVCLARVYNTWIPSNRPGAPCLSRTAANKYYVAHLSGYHPDAPLEAWHDFVKREIQYGSSTH